MADTYFRASVGAFIVNDAGQLLVAQKPAYNGKWHIVKGGIELGETPEQTLQREIFEELGVSTYELLGKSKLDFIHFDDRDYGLEEVVRVGQATLAYWVKIAQTDGFAVPNEEITAVQWIDITESSIRQHFRQHDSFEALATYLPQEATTILTEHAASKI